MKTVTAQAPINIALIKYWGKRDETEVLPYNPSISLSLALFQTTTTLEATDGPLTVTLNGATDPALTNKVATFLAQFTEAPVTGLRVITQNSGPTAAGLASSASGFAALAKAAQAYFNVPHNDTDLARMTRKGSGSAVRSLDGPCVLWHTDGFIHPIDWPFPDAKVAFMIVDGTPKEFPSTSAMKHTALTAPSYAAWVKQSHDDAVLFQTLCAQRDFSALGALTERNALALHAVCADAKPPVTYLNDRSRTIIQAVQRARHDQLFEAYCTMDAGPNVKLLYRAHDEAAIIRWAKAHGFMTPLLSDLHHEGAGIVHVSD